MVKAEFVNSFLTAAEEILNQELSEKIEFGKVSGTVTDKTVDEVSVGFKLTGYLDGLVVYCCSKDTAVKYLERKIGEKTSDDSLISDAFGELGNMLTGRSCMHLNKVGFEVHFSTPIFLLGAGNTIYEIPVATIQVPVQMSIGPINIVVGVKIRQT